MPASLARPTPPDPSADERGGRPMRRPLAPRQRRKRGEGRGEGDWLRRLAAPPIWPGVRAMRKKGRATRAEISAANDRKD